MQFGYTKNKKLTYENFAHLIPESASTELSTQTLSPIEFKSFKEIVDLAIIKINDPTYQKMSRKVTINGYKRIGHYLFKLALQDFKYSPNAYCNECKKKLDAANRPIGGYLNETNLTTISMYNKLNAAIKIIKDPKNAKLNPIMFYAALILTSYIHSGKMYMAKYMRLINLYDVIRAAMIFKTIDHFNISLNELSTIRSSPRKNQFIEFQNVNIKTPKINNEFELDKSEFTELLESMNKFVMMSPQTNSLQIISGDELMRTEQDSKYEDSIATKDPLRLEYETTAQLKLN